MAVWLVTGGAGYIVLGEHRISGVIHLAARKAVEAGLVQPAGPAVAG
jgi:hypothetical protein